MNFWVTVTPGVHPGGPPRGSTPGSTGFHLHSVRKIRRGAVGLKVLKLLKVNQSLPGCRLLCTRLHTVSNILHLQSNVQWTKNSFRMSWGNWQVKDKSRKNRSSKYFSLRLGNCSGIGQNSNKTHPLQYETQDNRILPAYIFPLLILLLNELLVAVIWSIHTSEFLYKLPWRMSCETESYVALCGGIPKGEYWFWTWLMILAINKSSAHIESDLSAYIGDPLVAHQNSQPPTQHTQHTYNHQTEHFYQQLSLLDIS